jgi:hypothetical protein
MDSSRQEYPALLVSLDRPVSSATALLTISIARVGTERSGERSSGSRGTDFQDEQRNRRLAFGGCKPSAQSSPLGSQPSRNDERLKKHMRKALGGLPEDHNEMEAHH